ncbi:MAG: hypothetical protein V4530_06040 [Pseudomonadota bacterium]
MNGRIILASVLAIGFMVLLGLAMFANINETAQRIVDGGIGALGTSLAVAVQGVFRTDKVDEQRANNTGAALDAISTAINATPPGGKDGTSDVNLAEVGGKPVEAKS